MLYRIAVLTLATYREAVRARVLLGVLAAALATCAYSAVVSEMSLHDELRVVSDIGAASMSGYAVLVCIVLGSSSLYRELEHRTVFPILSRPVRRWEYLLGKYLGALLTVAVFVALDASATLTLLGLEAGQHPWKVGVMALAMGAMLGVALWRAVHVRIFVVIPWSLALAVATWMLAEPSLDERQLVVASSLLTLCEAGIVTGVASLFASFSSPYLTATFTAGIFLMGRSADTLAHLPPKLIGASGARIGAVVARIVPNLHAYVPARPLLLGQASGAPLWPYVGTAAIYAVAYATVLLVLSALAFRKRDFA
jgi:ABC-type transport system involved in multi-copper enzyme maturation permease subunit